MGHLGPPWALVCEMIEMLRCYHLVFHPPLKLSRLNDARHRIQPGDDEAFDLRSRTLSALLRAVKSQVFVSVKPGMGVVGFVRFAKK